MGLDDIEQTIEAMRQQMATTADAIDNVRQRVQRLELVVADIRREVEQLRIGLYTDEYP